MVPSGTAAEAGAGLSKSRPIPKDTEHNNLRVSVPNNRDFLIDSFVITLKTILAVGSGAIHQEDIRLLFQREINLHSIFIENIHLSLGRYRIPLLNNGSGRGDT